MATRKRTTPAKAPTETTPPVATTPEAPAAPAQVEGEAVTPQAQQAIADGSAATEVMSELQHAEGDGIEKEAVPAVADGVERETTLDAPQAEAAAAAEAKAPEPLPDVIDLGDGRILRATKAGLPNTCSVSGQPCTDRWFAANTDTARSGLGICEEAVRELQQLLNDAKS